MATPPIVGTSRIRVRDGVTAREFDTEWVLLDLTAGSYFGLDEVAGEIWQQLCARHTPMEIAARLAIAYNAPEHLILQDVLAFTGDLVARGLVDVSD